MITLPKKQLKVLSWSKNGWKRDKVVIAAKPKTAYQQTDIINPEYTDDLSLLREAQNEVVTGSVHAAMDLLPSALKHLLIATDHWHISNNKLFKIIDPITQVKAYGHWGSDQDDKDLDVTEDKCTLGRMFLEQNCVLDPNASTEEYTDLMGDLIESSNREVLSYAPLIRVDYSVLSEEDDNAHLFYKQEYVPISIPRSETRLEELQEEYNNDLVKAETEAEREIALLKYEQNIDNTISKELTLSLNSRFTAFGYSPPRRRYEFVSTDKKSSLTGSAEEREKFFWDLFAEAQDCSSYSDLFGPIKPNTKERNFSLSFYGKIRSMYQHDKELNIKWSLEDKTDKDNNVSESAFSKDKRRYINKLRKANHDEETIRSLVWNQFNREAAEVAGKSIKDSVWRQQRTKALQDLFLTTAQWGAIYQILNIIQAKLKRNQKTDEEEQKTIVLLKKHFSRIQNLADLNAYRQWAETRKWNKYKFTPSLIDRLSVYNSHRWWRSVIKKQRFLMQRMQLFTHLDNSIKSVKDTNIEPLIADCPDSNCRAGNFISPKFAEIKDNKGFLFVECERCGKNIWLIDPKESGSDIKTLEEIKYED